MTLATIKQDIIKQYNRLLNKRYISALNFLLSPCCTISGTGEAVCSNVNRFALTITLDGPLPSFPVEYPIYVHATTSAVATGTYTAPNTITTTLDFVGGGITNVTQDVTVILNFPTSVDGSIGVYHNFIVPGVVFNGNPCD